MLTEILGDLYAEEFNVKIVSFWDTGFHIGLGDHLNGYEGEGQADRAEEIPGVIILLVLQAYPTSAFAKKYGKYYCDHDWEDIGMGRKQCTYPDCQKIEEL